MNKILMLILVSLSFICSNANCKGSVTGLPIPRFISLKFNEINVRKGPNASYPIVWVYKVKGYPMEVIEEFENWRKIKDMEGSEGWVHETQISGARHVIINDNKYRNEVNRYSIFSRELIVFRYPDELSFPMLRVEIGVIAKLKKCDALWCKIKIEDTVGWVRKENLWGIYPNETFK